MTHYDKHAMVGCRTSIGGVVLSIAMVIGSTIAATSISVRDDLGLGLGGVRDPKHP